MARPLLLALTMLACKSPPSAARVVPHEADATPETAVPSDAGPLDAAIGYAPLHASVDGVYTAREHCAGAEAVHVLTVKGASAELTSAFTKNSSHAVHPGHRDARGSGEAALAAIGHLRSALGAVGDVREVVAAALTTMRHIGTMW